MLQQFGIVEFTWRVEEIFSAGNLLSYTLLLSLAVIVGILILLGCIKGTEYTTTVL